MLCGCTSTSIFCGATSKSHLASIISKPLFIMLAESMVIFAPIVQLGCFKACAAVAFLSWSIGVVLNGPPDAVSNIFSIGLFPSPARHWNIAECSESTGKIGDLYFCANSQMSSPATTSVSLFAKAMVFPASMAAMVDANPA